MNTRQSPRLHALFASLLPLALMTAACAGKKEAPAKPPVPVSVAQASLEQAPLRLAAPGAVEAKNTVDVRSRVGGQILQVHFHEGDEVKQGQLLFTIDSLPLKAALDQAKAKLQHDRVLSDNAGREAARYGELVKKDFVTKEEHDAKEADARSQTANLAADEAAVQDARLMLGYAAIHAPITGRVGAVLIHAGNNVKANDDSLVVLHQMAPIDVKFALPQQYLAEVRRRAAAGQLPVTAIDSTGQQHTGHLAFIDNAVDPQTGTIQLKSTFDNGDRNLWPGELVQVSLQLGDERAIVAPEAAVQSGQDGDYVFVVKADQTVESRPVKVARSLGDRVVIGSGLRDGETVVTEGQLRLVNGAKVTVKPGAEAAARPADAHGSGTQGGNR